MAIFAGEVIGKGFVDDFVDHEDVCFSGFGFFYGAGVADSFVGEVFYFKAEDVACSDFVVDAEGKEWEVF